jgi:hypothetical protein
MMPHREMPADDSVAYDASDWPIFRVTMPARGLAPAAFRVHLDRVTAVYERGEAFGLLIDALRAPPLNASERQLVAEEMRFNARRHPGVLRGMALCLASTVARGGFTAINWLARPPYPTAAFETVASANVWLKRQLGVPTSPHTRTRA